MCTVAVLQVPIITQVWDLLETRPDGQQTQQPERLRQSSSTADDDSGRRLSLKKLFQPRSWRQANRQSRQDGPQMVTTSVSELNGDDSSLLTSHVVAGIPSTEIDLVNYIVAHGILSKQLR